MIISNFNYYNQDLKDELKEETEIKPVCLI